MIITFCGHADFQGNPGSERKMLLLLEEIAGDGDAELFLGGYGGFDAFARACGEKYQKTHPNVRLILILPYLPEQDAPTSCRYDETIYPELESTPPKFAIVKRNRWMVERADVVIGYVRHDWGGAYQTFAYAKRRGKRCVNFAEHEMSDPK